MLTYHAPHSSSASESTHFSIPQNCPCDFNLHTAMKVIKYFKIQIPKYPSSHFQVVSLFILSYFSAQSDHTFYHTVRDKATAFHFQNMIGNILPLWFGLLWL